MTTIKQQLDADLKQAMLAGDKTLAMTLRGLKSTILYAEVAEGKRDTGLENDAIVNLFQKELKKRQESADLYVQGGNQEKADAELAEKKVISQYLPEQIGDEELVALVEEAITQCGAQSMQQMGQVIGLVKAKAGATVDGARLASVVKERLQR